MDERLQAIDIELCQADAHIAAALRIFAQIKDEEGEPIGDDVFTDLRMAQRRVRKIKSRVPATAAA